MSLIVVLRGAALPWAPPGRAGLCPRPWKGGGDAVVSDIFLFQMLGDIPALKK